jgi:2-C-methyl-D-erythritol 4-phosphate cytidylyltransferase
MRPTFPPPPDNSPTSSSPRYAILVAGGSGLRMGANRPKQFLLLRGEPVLLHTLRRFADPALGVVQTVQTMLTRRPTRW